MKHKTIELILFIVAIIVIGTALVLVYQNRKPKPLLPTEIVMSPTPIPTYTITPKPTKIIPAPTNPVPTEYRNLKAYEVTNGSKPGWKKVMSERYKISFEYPEDPFVSFLPNHNSYYPSVTFELITSQTSINGPHINMYFELNNKKLTPTPNMRRIYIDNVEAYESVEQGKGIFEKRIDFINSNIKYHYRLLIPNDPKIKTQYNKLFEQIIKTIHFLK